MWIGAAILGCVIIVSLVVTMTHSTFKPRPVPDLQAIEQSIRTNQGGAQGSGPVSALPDDAPAPMIGDPAELRNGFVRIRGLMVGDTIVINRATVAIARGHDTSLSVPAGRPRVEIRRVKGKALSRVLDIVPLQTTDWNL